MAVRPPPPATTESASGVAPGGRAPCDRAAHVVAVPSALLQDDAAAILYAADRGANILSLSWGDVVRRRSLTGDPLRARLDASWWPTQKHAGR
jgi:hypothetical protein